MPGRERQIQVHRSNNNVMDEEFSSMRERFESEMRRVEDEMTRLRREFEGYTPKLSHAQPAPLPQSQPAVQTTNGASAGHSPASYASSANSPRYDPHLDAIKSPLIRDESDGKTLRLRFDVSHYAPEEVSVKTVDHRLLVHARHEEKTPQRTVYREYNQEFMLPRGTNPEQIRSSLSVDGVLTVEAPLPALPNHQQPQAIQAPHSPHNISHRGVY